MAAPITVWQDDPGEPGKAGRTMEVGRPGSLRTGALPLAFVQDVPKPDASPGSEGMRWWTAAATLHRARAVWLEAVNGTPRWQATKILQVDLEAGSEVNAYYDRGQLSFHVATVMDRDARTRHRIATGESPDIVAHELGHGVLDAVRPELWDANYAEVAAFHESFGDISSILTALAVPEIAKEFAALPGSTVFQSSRVSRLGEQMGWALRQQRPDLPDPNCLRDAVNTFFYVAPETLPTTAPSATLSSEPHNFSRVFTAAFMRVLDEMLKANTGKRTAASVRKVATLAASMLIAAIEDAPVTDGYYRAVAIEMIDEAGRRLRGRYRKAVSTAFVRTGIVTVAEATEAGRAAPPPRGSRRRGAAGDVAVAAVAPAMGAAAGATPLAAAPTRMDLGAFGVDAELELELGEAPLAQPSRRRGAVGGTGDDAGAQVTHTSSAHFFVEDLFRRNRLDLGSDERAAGSPLQHPRTVTHRFERTDGALRIRRLRVDCGFDVS